MKTTIVTLMLTLVCGCAAYRWTSSVPQDMRTVNVPTFRNESDLVEIGSIATRQVLREFQREGTFKISNEGAIEIQGVINSASAGSISFDRTTYMRHKEHSLKLSATVSVIDHKNGRVLVNNRRYNAEVSYSAIQDVNTANRDASARAADELARQIVDDVLAYNWNNEEKGASENE